MKDFHSNMANQMVKVNPQDQLKVLIIDCDHASLTTLENMLHICNFMVTKCQHTKEALSISQEDHSCYDIIIIDYDVPDSFEVVRRIGLEMKFPILMMLPYDDVSLMRKALRSGAIDYLVKPICMEKVRYLWKYVYIKERSNLLTKEVERSEGYCDSDMSNNIDSKHIVSATTSKGGNQIHVNCLKNRRDTKKIGDLEVKNLANTKKKQRVIWTNELHDKFVAAINQFEENAKVYPKKILEKMNVPGLTRENVASHLQKYRQYQNRKEQTLREQNKDNGHSDSQPGKPLETTYSINKNNFQEHTTSSLFIDSHSKFGLESQKPHFQAVYTEQYGEPDLQTTFEEYDCETRVERHIEEGNVICHPIITSFGLPWSASTEDKNDVGIYPFVADETTSISCLYANHDETLYQPFN